MVLGCLAKADCSAGRTQAIRQSLSSSFPCNQGSVFRPSGSSGPIHPRTAVSLTPISRKFVPQMGNTRIRSEKYLAKNLRFQKLGARYRSWFSEFPTRSAPVFARISKDEVVGNVDAPRLRLFGRVSYISSTRWMALVSSISTRCSMWTPYRNPCARRRFPQGAGRPSSLMRQRKSVDA